MSEKDKNIMDLLMNDKDKIYTVVVDNDCINVHKADDDDFYFKFDEFGYYFIVELFQYLNINAELC